MTSENITSRIAGLAYLVVVLTGIFSLAYVPSQITVPGDPQATVRNIVGSAPLFRLGIASFMLNQVAFLLLPLVLLQLFRPVSERVAFVMAALALASVPIALMSLTHRLDVLSLLSGPQAPSTSPPAPLQAAVMQHLDAYRNGLLITKLFWGLWLFPFGYLVIKSGFLPRLLGVLLMLGCVGYLVHVFGQVLDPGFASTSLSDLALKPAALGEIGTCLWLLFVGARRQQPRAV